MRTPTITPPAISPLVVELMPENAGVCEEVEDVEGAFLVTLVGFVTLAAVAADVGSPLRVAVGLLSSTANVKNVRHRCPVTALGRATETYTKKARKC